MLYLKAANELLQNSKTGKGSSCSAQRPNIDLKTEYRNFEIKMVTFGFILRRGAKSHLVYKKVFLDVCSFEGCCAGFLLYFQYLLQLQLQNRFSINIYHMKEEIYQQSEKTAFTHLSGAC